MNNNNFSLNDALNNFQYDILRFPVLFKDDEKNKILLLNKEIKGFTRQLCICSNG